MQQMTWGITSCATASLSSARFWRMRRADSRFVTRLQAITQISSKNTRGAGTNHDQVSPSRNRLYRKSFMAPCMRV